MRGAVRNTGKAVSIVIRKWLLSKFGAEVSDNAELRVEAGGLVVTRVAQAPRRGWAEDGKGLADDGDDDLAWPEFANDGDAAPVW